MPLSFVNELKRRNVFKVTVAYGLVAWLIAQLAEFAISTFGAPDWVLRTFVVLLVLGLPIAIVLAWIFDMTPSGVRKTSSSDATTGSKPNGMNIMVIILMGVVLVAAVVLQFWGPEMPAPMSEKQSRQPSGVPTLHADIAFPDDIDLAFIGAAALGNGRRAFTISPDGQRIVFAGVRGGEHALYIRDLDSHNVRKLAGTEDGYDPFFSPNGQWIAFFAGNQLKRVASSGGDSVAVTEASNSNGGTWIGNDRILAFTGEGDNLLQFTFGGAREESAASVDGAAPFALPGGAHVLLHDDYIMAFDTATGEYTKLPVRGLNPRYLGGFLFYTQRDTLIAARFDPGTLTIKSTPVPVLTGVRTEIYGFSQWSLASNGTLLYASGISAAENPLTWNGANGRELLSLPQRQKGTFEISPDGRQLLVAEYQPDEVDIWLYDLASGAARKLIGGPYIRGNALIWMPDSRQFIYHRRDRYGQVPYIMSLDSSDGGKPLLGGDKEALAVYSISANGRFLGAKRWAMTPEPEAGAQPSENAFIIDLEEDREISVPMMGTGNWGFSLSPQGDAVVYTSPVSGEYQNYLQPVPPTGVRYQVSRVGGAEEPRWSSDGSRIYYRSGLRIMVVDVQLSPEIVLGEPRVFYEGSFVNVGGRSYDISPDGSRALVIEGPENTARSIRLVTNWLEAVERIVSASEEP